MFRKLRLLASCITMTVAVTAGGLALAQTPASPQAPAAPVMPAPATPQAPAAPAAAAPATPQAPTAPAAPAVPLADLVASPAACDTGCAERGRRGCFFAPQMLGDGLNFVSGSAPPGTTIAGAPLIAAGGHVPVALDGAAFKIADNESAHPEDRVFTSFQYFAAVLENDHPPAGIVLPHIRYAVEVLGFEKTFLDGDASIGMRVPFFQIHSEDNSIDSSDAGDVTVIAKFALVNTECNVLSAGMAFTFPTGPDEVMPSVTNPTNGKTLPAVPYNPFIWQPFLGYVHTSGDAYVQAFTSLAIPFSDTVGCDWFNDLAVGYYAYRSDRALNALVPTAEFHIATPFGHQGSQGYPVGLIDTYTVTLGTHMIFRDHAVVSLGWNFALSGPQPYGGGFLAQFNYHF